MPDRSLDSLSPRFKPLAIELLARCVEAGIAVLIVNTRRTRAEQQENLRRGVSWTSHSKHLDGDAIDICPFMTWNLYGPDKGQWDGADPVWQQLGTLGEAVGLKWGGRWKKTPDLGHFEYQGVAAPAPAAPGISV